MEGPGGGGVMGDPHSGRAQGSRMKASEMQL